MSAALCEPGVQLWTTGSTARSCSALCPLCMGTLHDERVRCGEHWAQAVVVLACSCCLMLVVAIGRHLGEA